MIVYSIDIKPLDPWVELLLGVLSQLPETHFLETEEGLDMYVPEEFENEEEISKLLNSFPSVKLNFQKKTLEEKNWNKEWESNFQAVVVDDQILIRAAFHQTEEKYPFEINIEPKMSFGTGHHETTHLMLQHLLETDLKDQTVWDMGCGTAVLGIFAKICGSKKVYASDIDDWAKENAEENAQRNGVELSIYKGGVETLRMNVEIDVFLANINRNVLLTDLPEYCRALKQGGLLIMSGYLEEDIEHIDTACKRLNLKKKDEKRRKKWMASKWEK